MPDKLINGYKLTTEVPCAAYNLTAKHLALESLSDRNLFLLFLPSLLSEECQ